MEVLAKNLVEYRKSFGITQEELAEKLFVTRQAVSRWEHDECTPDLETLIAISQLYSVTVDELIKVPYSQRQKEQSPALSEMSNTDELKEKHKKDLVRSMVTFFVAATAAVSLVLGILYSALATQSQYIWIAWFSLPLLVAAGFMIRFRHEIGKRWIMFIFPVPFLSGMIYLLIHYLLPDSSGGWLAFLIIPFYYALAAVVAIFSKKQKK
ncbi:MAG: helix-turn-helix domain-containing protein [Christensenellales bacterium]